MPPVTNRIIAPSDTGRPAELLRADAPPAQILKAFKPGEFGTDKVPTGSNVISLTNQRGFAEQKGVHLGSFAEKAIDICKYLVGQNARPVHVVEMGPGAGNLSVRLAQAGGKITAMDCVDNFSPAAKALTVGAGQRKHKPGTINHILTTIEEASHTDFPWTAKLFVAEKFGHWLPDAELHKVVATMTDRAADGAVAMFSLASFDSYFVQGRYYTQEARRSTDEADQVRIPVTPKTPIELRHVPSENPNDHLGGPITPRTRWEVRSLFEDYGWRLENMQPSRKGLMWEAIFTLNRGKGPTQDLLAKLAR